MNKVKHFFRRLLDIPPYKVGTPVTFHDVMSQAYRSVSFYSCESCCYYDFCSKGVYPPVMPSYSPAPCGPYFERTGKLIHFVKL